MAHAQCVYIWGEELHACDRSQETCISSSYVCCKMLSLVRVSRLLPRHTSSALSAMAARSREYSNAGARSPIQKITVIGSGLMGSGIAQVCSMLLALGGRI